MKLRLYNLRRWMRRTFAPPRYFVATYGDMGLEVEFYRDEQEYDAAVALAEEEHDADNLDTYTYGDI